MRKFLRILLNALSALSTLLFAAICVLWMRSYTSSDQIRWINATGSRSLYSAKGQVVLSLSLEDYSGYLDEFCGPRYERQAACKPFNWLVAMGVPTWNSTIHWEGAAFEWQSTRNPRTGDFYAFGVAPFWSLALTTSVLPLLWTKSRLRPRIRACRRKKKGLCPTCGYDLRATRNLCPECGAITTEASDPSAPSP